MADLDKNLPETPDTGEDFESDIITVIDDNGKEYSFEELDRIELDNGKKYVALVEDFSDKVGDPAILESSAELFFLRVIEEEGENGAIEFFLEEIDDDDEYEEVASIFTERLGDYYDIAETYMGEDDGPSGEDG